MPYLSVPGNKERIRENENPTSEDSSNEEFRIWNLV